MSTTKRFSNATTVAPVADNTNIMTAEPPLPTEGGPAHWEDYVDGDHWEQPGNLFRLMTLVHVQSGHCPKGTVEKVTCWPMPEEQDNKNMTIENLGLTNAEENDLVAFLQTLTDGFVTVTPASLSKPKVVRKAALPPLSH
jgi:hypothetical protein